MGAGMTVMQGLFHILEYRDPSLAFRYSCREAVCGSCALLANGEFRLACRTQVEDLLEPASGGGNEILLEPLPAFPVIKDLVVDLSGFFAAYAAARPYLINPDAPARGHLQDPGDRKLLEKVIDCLLCGICHENDSGDEGSQIQVLTALRFLADSRDTDDGRRRLLVNGGKEAAAGFRPLQRCPKGIDALALAVRLDCLQST